jgi:hypothetical protein
MNIKQCCARRSFYDDEYEFATELLKCEDIAEHESLWRSCLALRAAYWLFEEHIEALEGK